MGNLPRTRPRAIAMATVALTVAATVSAITVPAHADTKPSSSSTPTTVSSDSLATAQIVNGVAWAQAVAGNTVYVGGTFTGARAAGATTGSSARMERRSRRCSWAAIVLARSACSCATRRRPAGVITTRAARPSVGSASNRRWRARISASSSASAALAAP